jgi:hypothetical protein
MDVAVRHCTVHWSVAIAAREQEPHAALGAREQLLQILRNHEVTCINCKIAIK